MKVPRITPKELERMLDAGADVAVLDVRNDKDFEGSDKSIPGAVRIPVEELEARLGELDPATEVVAYCT
jgi:rhodanese-related sulfurtransferase